MVPMPLQQWRRPKSWSPSLGFRVQGSFLKFSVSVDVFKVSGVRCRVSAFEKQLLKPIRGRFNSDALQAGGAKPEP
jgi:hypothetical protein